MNGRMDDRCCDSDGKILMDIIVSRKRLQSVIIIPLAVVPVVFVEVKLAFIFETENKRK